MLAGGSAYGLDAAGGVMRWLEERGMGVAIGARRWAPRLRVPIVPAAILFDLWVGDPRIRPDAAAGYAACDAASRDGPPRATSAPAPARRSASCSASGGR